ncbi:MAG: NAAT family transporter [Coraliomargarita sp.]|nr:NAAT family transporter [Coraliomargarita sp.]
MESYLTFFGTAFAAFFAIMNPFANTPVFMGLTEELDSKTARKIALRSLTLTFCIVAVFALSGDFLLDFFGITLDAFRIAGGILVGLVGYHLLQGEHSSIHKPSDSQLDAASSDNAALGIAVSPLAMPILAGPGTLVTAMNYAAEGCIVQTSLLLSAFLLICTITYICFVSAKTLTKFLGQNLIMVISRIMGLILAAVGTQMLIEGIKGSLLAN